MPSGSDGPKPRRANGEGTYRKLPSGLWQNTAQKDDQKYSGTGDTKQKALAARKANQKTKSAVSAAKSRRSFFTCLEEAAARSAAKDAPTTAETYHYWATVLRDDPLGLKPVSDVVADDLADWWERCPLAHDTKRKRLSWYKGVLRREKIVVDFRCPRRTDGGHVRRPLDPPERERLIALFAEMPEELLLMCRLCWRMGLRRSEALGLRHEDRDGAGVRLRRTVTRTKGRIHVRPKGKNAKALAWVPIPLDLRNVIGAESSGFVVGGGTDPMDPRTISDGFREFIRRANIGGAHAGLHALRRTFGTTLLEDGTDVVTAAKAMRHDPKTLLEEYARSRDDLTAAAVARSFDPKVEMPSRKRRHLIRRAHQVPHG